MSLILIAIQPEEPDPSLDNMKKLEEVIKGKGNPCHVFGYTWITNTPLDPSEISKHLNKWLKPNDKFIIAPLSDSEPWLCRADNDCYQF